MIEDLYQDIHALKNPQKAQILQRFFKTGKGEYGEGDVFVGITVPELTKLSKIYKDLSIGDLETLLSSSVHEERFLGLRIIRLNFEKSKQLGEKHARFTFSKKHISSLNNWDLVDSFIPYVWGKYFFDKPKDELYTLAASQNLWERRIAIMTTFYFLKNKDFSHTLALAKILMHDTHDLIHKAVGWMLREIGKRELSVLLNFLETYHKTLPRTMLRYAIEKLSKEQKVYFMKR